MLWKYVKFSSSSSFQAHVSLFTFILHSHMKKRKHFFFFFKLCLFEETLYSAFLKLPIDNTMQKVIIWQRQVGHALSFLCNGTFSSSSVSFMTRLKNIDKSHSGSSVICIIMNLRELALLCVKHIVVVKSILSCISKNVKNLQLRLGVILKSKQIETLNELLWQIFYRVKCCLEEPTI